MSKPKQSRWVGGWERWECRRCSQWLIRDEFHKEAPASNGLRSWCKACEKEYLRLKRQEDPDRFRASARRTREKNKSSRKEYAASYYKQNKKKAQAQAAVREAVRRGDLVRSVACEVCGEECFTVAHHDSYEPARWLVVVWMCDSCHMWTHARRNKHDYEAGE